MAKGDPVRIVPHEESFEVRFADGAPSTYFYFDDSASRRAVTKRVPRAEALEAARTFARNARIK